MGVCPLWSWPSSGAAGEALATPGLCVLTMTRASPGWREAEVWPGEAWAVWAPSVPLRLKAKETPPLIP